MRKITTFSRCRIEIHASWSLALWSLPFPSLAVGLLMTMGAAGWADQPPPEAVTPAKDGERIAPLNGEKQKRVNKAIEAGLVYLRRTQLPNGSWTRPPIASGLNTGMMSGGYAALAALTLLECDVPREDPAVQKAARFVRQNALTQTRTYEISLAILFLDRLGQVKDGPLIRSLALRLAAGQSAQGGWRYTCPLLKPAQEEKVLQILRNWKPEESPKKSTLQPKGKDAKGMPRDNADNSNTQFAILALWTARKHNLPLDFIFAQIEKRFRSTQLDNGWDYTIRKRSPYGSMTCVGLLGLAVGRGSGPEDAKTAGLAEKSKPVDEGIASGLRALGRYMEDPYDLRGDGLGAKDFTLGPKGSLNLYFLWSVERVGVLLNLKTIGGKDWYRWGVDLLLPAQKDDGSWIGRGNGISPVIDTSMALLFLKRSDLLPDLRETLQKRLKITDPGLDKAISPGEKSDRKKGTKSPAEKGHDTGKKSELKSGIPKKEGDEKTKPHSRLGPQPADIMASAYLVRAWWNAPMPSEFSASRSAGNGERSGP